MQGSIGKHRVKFVGKVEFVSVDYPSVKTAIHGGLHHHGTQVDTDSLAAKLLNLFGQHTIAAAQIENSFARSG